MSDEFFIADGYTKSLTVPATARRRAYKVSYRPALAAERLALMRHGSQDPDRYAAKAVDLVTSHVSEWDGAEPVNRANVTRLQPDIFDSILDAVLGYSPAEESADAGNSGPASA